MKSPKTEKETLVRELQKLWWASSWRNDHTCWEGKLFLQEIKKSYSIVLADSCVDGAHMWVVRQTSHYFTEE